MESRWVAKSEISKETGHLFSFFKSTLSCPPPNDCNLFWIRGCVLLFKVLHSANGIFFGLTHSDIMCLIVPPYNDTFDLLISFLSSLRLPECPETTVYTYFAWKGNTPLHFSKLERRCLLIWTRLIYSLTSFPSLGSTSATNTSQWRLQRAGIFPLSFTLTSTPGLHNPITTIFTS